MSLDLVLAAFYSGQQGSLLYWAWTLSIFTAIVLWQQRKPGPHRVFMPYVVAVLMTIEAFMTLLLGFVATPFETLPLTPPDGVGLNPLLYDAGHARPPADAAGRPDEPGAVPFAFAIAALATGKLGNEWIALTRRYALVAWVILGLGNVLGAWWAYHVLGWGGYWGWDPVENVALMPWLVGTAFIHSIQIQERRGHAESVEHRPDHRRVLPEHLRHVRRPQRHSGLGALLRPVVDRAVLPDLPRPGDRLARSRSSSGDCRSFGRTISSIGCSRARRASC